MQREMSEGKAEAAEERKKRGRGTNEAAGGGLPQGGRNGI